MQSSAATLIPLCWRSQITFPIPLLLQDSNCSHSYPLLSWLFPPIYISSSQDCCILESEVLWRMGKNIEKKNLCKKSFWYVHDHKVKTGHMQKHHSIPTSLQYCQLKLQYQHSRLNVPSWSASTGNTQLPCSASSYPCFPSFYPHQLILQKLPAMFFLPFPVLLCLIKLKHSPEQV